MCSSAGINFGKRYCRASEIRGRKVLELGARNVNGSWRNFVEEFHPKTYTGTDIIPGPGVDITCDAGQVDEMFGKSCFDVVIATELLEHVLDWRKVISSIKNVLKPGGLLFITTRSKGYGYHAYPYDFWRWEIADMEHIFSDMKIIRIQKDESNPGVFIKIKKPPKFKEIKLTGFSLYSILKSKRSRNVSPLDIFWGKIWYGGRRLLWQLLPNMLKKWIITFQKMSVRL